MSQLTPQEHNEIVLLSLWYIGESAWQRQFEALNAAVDKTAPSLPQPKSRFEEGGR